MDTLTAKPGLLKKANLSCIRKVIKSKGTVTRAEITQETRISSTTVRSLLTEMIQDGEIQSVGYDESSGGRKAERYCFKTDRYYSVTFCIENMEIHALTVNICGEIVESVRLENRDGNIQRAIFIYLDEVIAQREIKSIGIGVPGIVEGGSYWKKKEENGSFYKVDIGNDITRRYGLPVIMENDLNATIIGVGRCFTKEHPSEKQESQNMAYLYFEKGCLSAGFIADGRIIRGSNNYAGELGLIPAGNGRLLDECLAESVEDACYTNVVIKIICWVCGILNPRYVVLAGPNFRNNCIGQIEEGVRTLLSENMLAEILYSSDMQHDYHNGMAYLTAEKMFDEVQFVKERI